MATTPSKAAPAGAAGPAAAGAGATTGKTAGPAGGKAASAAAVPGSPAPAPAPAAAAAAAAATPGTPDAQGSRTERSGSGLWSRIVDRNPFHAAATSGLETFLQGELANLAKEAGKKVNSVREVSACPFVGRCVRVCAYLCGYVCVCWRWG
jgi:hypothetical protein